jgi:fructokinase
MPAEHTTASLPSAWLIGEALLDEFPDLSVPGGAPFNVARSMAALGQDALLISRVGAADAGAALLLDEMRRLGMDERGLQRDPLRPTGRVRIEEEGAAGEHRFHIEADAAWDHLEFAPIETLLHAGRPALLYYGTLAQRSVDSRAAVQALLARCPPDLLCYLDLNLRPGVDTTSFLLPSLQRADWLKVNADELAWLLERFGLAGPAALVQRFGLQRLIVTRGAAGYAAYGAQGECLAQEGGVPQPRLVDTVGAGDAFSAMLLTASLRGLAFASALTLANRYASATCGLRGPLPREPGFFAPWRVALGT